MGARVGGRCRGRQLTGLGDGLGGTGLQHRRRRRRRRHRTHHRRGHRIVGTHRRRRLNPHPDIVRLVQRDRNRVQAKEIRRGQHPMNHMIGSQLRQRGHHRQRRRVRRRRTLMLGSSDLTLRLSLRQPPQIRRMRSDILRGTGPCHEPCAAPNTPRSSAAASAYSAPSACHAAAAANNAPGPGPLANNAECTSGGEAIQIGAVNGHSQSPSPPAQPPMSSKSSPCVAAPAAWAARSHAGDSPAPAEGVAASLGSPNLTLAAVRRPQQRVGSRPG